jgi:hypothetical protein
MAVSPGRLNLVASSMAFWMAGSRNASVFPEPVPVVTTTGRGSGDSSSWIASD